MKVLIVGANGKIGRRLIPHLVAEGMTVRAMVRDQAQSESLRELGAHEVVVADLEGDCRQALAGQDAVVFSAGSGAHTGPDKTIDVDQNGAISVMDQAREQGVKRFVMVSSMRADDPNSGPEKMRHYFVAKQTADNHLRGSGLDYTIVRPGRLTEAPPLDKVDVAERLEQFGDISREDVARVLAVTLMLGTVHREFDVIQGNTPIHDAIAAL
ncbi:MAG: SDR family oxidoreductase [Alcanivorax sp.]|nr:SDR family oxidoreductase [Alcanivorax sp.]